MGWPWTASPKCSCSCLKKCERVGPTIRRKLWQQRLRLDGREISSGPMFIQQSASKRRSSITRRILGHMQMHVASSPVCEMKPIATAWFWTWTPSPQLPTVVYLHSSAGTWGRAHLPSCPVPPAAGSSTINPSGTLPCQMNTRDAHAPSYTSIDIECRRAAAIDLCKSYSHSFRKVAVGRNKEQFFSAEEDTMPLFLKRQKKMMTIISSTMLLYNRYVQRRPLYYTMSISSECW